MTETVSQAVEQREKSPAAIIASYNNIFTDVLPAHIKPDAFVRLAQGVIRKDDKLALAARNDMGSLMASLLDCARLGHEPGTPAYYLVPIKGKVEGWEGYRGVIERIYRAGAVQAVKAAVVRENDQYVYEEGMPRPIHRHPRFATAQERGPLVGVYAYAEMRAGGTSRVIEMARDVVMRHKAMSQASDRADSPWQKWEESMWLKCAAHELEKWVPSSTEYRRGELRAAAEAQRIVDAPHATNAAPAETVDYVDGTIVEGTGDESWPVTPTPPDAS